MKNIVFTDLWNNDVVQRITIVASGRRNRRRVGSGSTQTKVGCGDLGRGAQVLLLVVMGLVRFELDGDLNSLI